MFKSRLIIGITVALLIAAALFYVGSVRYTDVTNPWRYHTSGYPGYPPIGIVRWWSYITPLAMGAGAAACLRRTVPTITLLAAVVISSVICSMLLRIAFLESPEDRLLEIQRFLWPAQTPPIEVNTLVGNIGLIGTSLFFAFFTVSKLRTERRAQRHLHQFPQSEIAHSLQPIMDPHLIRPSRFAISPILRTRIMIGLIGALLIALPLYLVGAVRYQTHYSALIEAHTQAGLHFELPSLVRVLWPFGLVRWWSYITPLAVGVGIGARLRHPTSIFPLMASLIGALVICATTWQCFYLHAKMFSYMGYLAVDPIEPEIFWGNILAITASLCFATLSVIGLIKPSDQPPADSGN